MDNNPKELVVEVTPNGQWIFPDQKKRGKAWSCTIPIDVMTGIIARKLGQKRDQITNFKFKIVAIEQEG